MIGSILMVIGLAAMFLFVVVAMIALGIELIRAQEWLFLFIVLVVGIIVTGMVLHTVGI